jgi:hypothetical protein
MSSAIVTVKLSPHDFDLLITCATEVRNIANAVAKDDRIDAKQRHDSRQRSVELDNLIRNLQS